MKSILLVTSDFYPKSGACSNIIDSLIKEFEKHFAVCVVSCRASNEVVEHPSIVSYESCSFKKIKGLINRSNALLQKIVIRIQKKLGLYYYNYFEYKAFIKLFKKIKANQFDFVFTVSGNFSNTFACLDFFKKRKTRIISYQVDPLINNNCCNKKNLKKRFNSC